MLNVLFVAPDVCLLSNDSVFSARGSRAQDQLDITSMSVLDKLCDLAGCHLVLCGKWRSNAVVPNWWTAFFRGKGFKNAHFIGQTPIAETPALAVEEWLKSTPVAIDRYAVIDEATGYSPNQPVIVPPAMQGLRLTEALMALNLLKPDSPLLSEWADIWNVK